MKFSIRDLLLVTVGFLVGVPFGATFVYNLPGREDRFIRENRQLQEELRLAREGAEKKLPNSSAPAPNPPKP